MARAKIMIVLFALSMVFSFLLSCESSSSIHSGKGNVRIYLTDVPLNLSNVEAVHVTIDEVVIFPQKTEGEQAIPIHINASEYTGQGATFDLLSLVHGEKALLGEATVDSGFYDHMRLNVSSGELLIDDDWDASTDPIIESLLIPSERVDLASPFEVRDGFTTYVTIDFDVSQSIEVNDNPQEYILRPVINHVSTEIVE